MSGTFTYLLIPADTNLPIQTLTASKAGGLSDDALQKEAKQYFFERSDKKAMQEAIEQANPEQRKQLADKMRQEVQMATAGQMNAAAFSNLDDDQLIEIMKSTKSSATCEITALTLPTPRNSHRGVSMYTADDARLQNLPHNPRATSLLTSCGHAIPTEKTSIGGAPVGGIHGDAFVGRYHDNELEDIWERESMTLKDVDIFDTTNNSPVVLPEWIDTALKPGGGGSVSATNLSNVNTIEDLKIGQEEKYSWSQNDDEVELRFPIDNGVKSKDCKVDFKMKSVKVTVGGEILLDATLGGDVDVEDSTFTIEDGRENGRELCITLGKKERYTWRTVASPK
ncbi:hypothetical protein ACHAXN_006039 [Cyclotella atomus]